MPLKIVIVGAGIGGLAAAIALTKSGHEVEVFEKSSFHTEVGAAVHLAPNAVRVLKQWDCDLYAMDPVKCEYMSLWDKQGHHIATPVVAQELKQRLEIDEEWFLVHRVDLHNFLRTTAERGFGGRKPTIHLSCAVESVDSIDGKIVLADGREVRADVIIGADGVHSRTVHEVADGLQKKKSTGQDCFRFLIPTEDIQANPTAQELIAKMGLSGANIIGSGNEKMVIYPCRSGMLLNCGVFVPSRQDNNGKEWAWLSSGQHEDLMAAVKEYGPEVRELCSLAKDVKFWSLATRDPPRKFFKGNIALIGDAAHPMLPHQGQGAAQAFEDAAALGTILTADMKPEQVIERLSIYHDVRYVHAVTMMFMSRVADELRETVMDDLKKFVPNAEMPKDMVSYAWKSNPSAVAENVLLSRSGNEVISS